MPDLILVVDDEPVVRSVVAAILRNAGYDVLDAASATEAMEIGRSHGAPIRLLLADVVMPGGNGPALADQFVSIHPETDCMFMAGLPDTAEISEKILSRGRPFLPKPFLAQELVGKVRQVLGHTARRAATA